MRKRGVLIFAIIIILLILVYTIVKVGSINDSNNKERAFELYQQGLKIEKMARGYQPSMRKAMDFYKQSLILDPDHNKSDYCRARIAGYINDDYETAHEELLKAYEKDRNDYRVIQALGYAAKNIEKYDEALEYFEILKEMDLDSSTAYSGRGSVFRDMGKYDEAIEEFKKAYEKFQGFGLLLQIGNCYRKKKDYANAAKYYDLLVEERPNTGHCRSLGDCYRYLKQYKKAIQAYNNSLSHKANNSKTLYGIGRIYLDKGNYQLAIDYFEKCLASNPDHKDAIKYLRITEEEIEAHGAK